MSESVTLELTPEIAKRVKEVAARTHRRPEDILVEWLDRAAADPPIETLSDREILDLCDSQMEADEQAALSRLLVSNREGTLSEAERRELDEVMQVYRAGLIRKAQAWQVAVERGLQPLLD